MGKRWNEWSDDEMEALKRDILKAIRDNDIAFIERLLDEGLPAGERWKMGNETLMHKLAWSNQLTTPRANKLLHCGASLDDRTGLGDTMLHGAVAAGSEKSVRVLLQLSADPNALNDDGRTPMHTAADYGKGIVLRMLFRAGGKVDQPDKLGKIPQEVIGEREERTRGMHYPGDHKYEDRQNNRVEMKKHIFGEFQKWVGKQSEIAPLLKDEQSSESWLGSGTPFTAGDITQATWDYFPAVLEKLRQSGQPVCEEDLWVDVGEDASARVNILSFAARDLQLPKVVAALRTEGVSLGAKTLLNVDGTPSEVCEALARHQCLNQLFTVENWEVRPKAELGKVLAALPDEYRDFVPNAHRLMAAVGRQLNQQQGRLA